MLKIIEAEREKPFLNTYILGLASHPNRSMENICAECCFLFYSFLVSFSCISALTHHTTPSAYASTSNASSPIIPKPSKTTPNPNHPPPAPQAQPQPQPQPEPPPTQKKKENKPPKHAQLWSYIFTAARGSEITQVPPTHFSYAICMLYVGVGRPHCKRTNGLLLDSDVEKRSDG